jgi:hypothetical protein
MKITLTESQFISQFMQVRPNNFSRPALSALFDHLEEMEEMMDEEIEMDAVGLCCDWTEYGSALEAAVAYEFQPDALEVGKEVEAEEQALEFLHRNTIALELGNGGVVIQNF